MIEHSIRDLRHAWRAMVRTPIVAAVVIGSLGVGIGVNTVVFSWIQAVVVNPLPGVVDASNFHTVDARGDAGIAPGVVVARVSRPSGAAVVALRCHRVSHGAVQRRRGQPHRARDRIARLRQLLLRTWSAAGARPLHRAARSRAPRRRAGRGGLVWLLADAAGRIRRRGRQHAAGQRRRPHRHRRDAGRLPGHGDEPAVRSVGAGDARARAVQRIARARRNAAFAGTS